MFDLEPGTFAWKLYAYYYCLGGQPYDPQEEIGVLLRRLLIWLPFRWLFAWERRVPAIVWIACVVWSVFNIGFAVRLMLFLLVGLVLNDVYQIVQFFTRGQYDEGSHGSRHVHGMSKDVQGRSQQH